MHSGLNDNVQGLKNIGILVKDWKNDIPMLNHRLSTVVTLFSWYTPFKKIGYRELNLNNFYEVIWRTKRLDIVLIQSFFLITGWANVQIKWRTLVWFWVNLEIKYSLNGKRFLVFIIIYVFESYSTFSGFDLVQHAEQHTKSVDRKVQQQQMLWIPYYKCFRICFNSSPSWRSYSASFNKPKRWYCSLSYCQFKPSS